jgi:hypothetical protein
LRIATILPSYKLNDRSFTGMLAWQQDIALQNRFLPGPLGLKARRESGRRI